MRHITTEASSNFVSCDVIYKTAQKKTNANPILIGNGVIESLSKIYDATATKKISFSITIKDLKDETCQSYVQVGDTRITLIKAKKELLPSIIAHACAFGILRASETLTNDKDLKTFSSIMGTAHVGGETLGVNLAELSAEDADNITIIGRAFHLATKEMADALGYGLIAKIWFEALLSAVGDVSDFATETMRLAKQHKGSVITESNGEKNVKPSLKCIKGAWKALNIKPTNKEEVCQIVPTVRSSSSPSIIVPARGDEGAGKVYSQTPPPPPPPPSTSSSVEAWNEYYYSGRNSPGC